MRYQRRRDTIEDTENPHGGVICASASIARRMARMLNCQSVVKGMLARQEFAEMRGQ